MSYTITPSDAPPADVDRLVELVGLVERTQRTEDVDGFVGLFDDDAVWVSAGGVRIVGREAIAAFTGSVLPGAMADGSVRYEVALVRFLTPDVALTSIDQEYLTADGASRSPRQVGRPSYVWRRDGGDWRIAVGQNTAVQG